MAHHLILSHYPLVAGHPWLVASPLPAFAACLSDRLAALAAWLQGERPRLDRPVFIVGCGRSGTTVLGEIFGHHPDLAYLNEPRDIWLADPRTDVWTERAAARGGRLELTEADAWPALARELSRRFAGALRQAGKSRLLGKTPIDSFRIAWIDALFPDALFLHIVRDGFEVAYSIANVKQDEPWFGHDDYKWRQLCAVAERRGLGDLVPLCRDDVARGMLEWRLAVIAARQALERLPAARWTEIRYDALVRNPGAGCQTVEQALGLAPSPAVREYATAVLHAPAAPARPWRPDLKDIGGPLLAELEAGAA